MNKYNITCEGDAIFLSTGGGGRECLGTDGPGFKHIKNTPQNTPIISTRNKVVFTSNRQMNLILEFTTL